MIKEGTRSESMQSSTNQVKQVENTHKEQINFMQRLYNAFSDINLHDRTWSHHIFKALESIKTKGLFPEMTMSIYVETDDTIKRYVLTVTW